MLDTKRIDFDTRVEHMKPDPTLTFERSGQIVSSHQLSGQLNELLLEEERRTWQRIWRIRVRIRMIKERSEEGGRGLVRREEEDTPEGWQPVVQVADTAMGEPLGLGYMALRRCELSAGEDQVPSTFDVGQSSRSVLEHQGAGRISAFREPTLVTNVDLVDGKVYTDILVYVPPVASVQTPPLPPLLSIRTPSSPEWPSSSFLVTPLSLVISTPVSSPATSSLAASPDTVEAEDFMAESDRDEIFSKRYRLRSLEREQKRATVTFSALWRSVLALEAWAGQTDAHRVALWHAMSDTQGENHDLRMQLNEERRERLELADRVARMERRQESREE
nr:hypothetical protein [Tanacetum cinerariifolium]